MIERKKKICSSCGELTYLFSKKRCLTCTKKEEQGSYKLNKSAKPISISKEDRKSVKPIHVSGKIRKATGELKLFKKIYEERGGKCEITGKQIQFNINSFAHILSKGAYGGYRLNPDNIIMVLPEIHYLYDNSSKEKLLREFPQAVIIYELKDKLRHQYYNS